MDTQKTSLENTRTTNQACAVGVLALICLTVFFVAVVLPFYIDISDQRGPFYLTLSPADLDGDGDLDVLVHNMRKPGEFEAWSGGTLWINQGGIQGGQIGTFAYRLNDIEGGWASTLADLDGDGVKDVLVYNNINRGLLLGINQSKVPGGQAGVFIRDDIIPLPRTQVAEYGVLVVGDIDGDGKVDAILLGRGQSSVAEDRAYQRNVSWTWLNKVPPKGQLFSWDTTAIAPLDGLSVAGAALGDLDGDGDLDLIVVASQTQEKTMNGSTGLILLNDGGGNFSDTGLRFPAKESSSVALGDLDGDRDLDALLGFDSGALVLINQGGAQGGLEGTFAVADHGIAGSRTRSVHLADLDGDGDQDAVIVGDQGAALFLNDRYGKFSQAVRILPCSERQDLTIADFNGDGSQDIFVAEYDQSVQLWFNNGKGSFTAGQ
jgi:hypothetical protein